MGLIYEIRRILLNDLFSDFIHYSFLWEFIKMKCEIAKNNPLIMDLAIEHYISGNKTTFTFMSLWSDEEPYSKKELIKCLKERIKKIEALILVLPTIGNEMTLKRLNKALNILNKQEKK